MYIFKFSVCVSVSPSRSQWGNDQTRVRMPGDHPVRAGEANDEDVPQGGEEGEETRQRNRRRLRCGIGL